MLKCCCNFYYVKIDLILFFKAGRIANHYKKTLYSSALNPDSQEYKILKSKAHHEAAEILLDLCCANKGVYIKVGQHLATLDYLVPPEYIKVMKVLHSNAPKSSLSSVYKVLRQDLKAEVSLMKNNSTFNE